MKTFIDHEGISSEIDIPGCYVHIEEGEFKGNIDLTANIVPKIHTKVLLENLKIKVEGDEFPLSIAGYNGYRVSFHSLGVRKSGVLTKQVQLCWGKNGEISLGKLDCYPAPLATPLSPGKSLLLLIVVLMFIGAMLAFAIFPQQSKSFFYHLKSLLFK